MKKRVYIFIMVFVLFFCLINKTYAKSVKCVYGNTISVILGIDEDGNLITTKNDANPLIYKFDKISAGAFIDGNGDYYCPDKVFYTYVTNSQSRKNDYVFSYISEANSPMSLSLVDSTIDNVSNNNNNGNGSNKVINKKCAYGETGKYIINYYNDGTVGPGDNSYKIFNDIPTTGDCLSSVYLCQGPIIYKEIQWNNNNCTKLDLFTGNFVQSGSQGQQSQGQNPSSGTSGPRLDYSSLCQNNKGIRDAARIIGYILAIGKWIVAFIIIIFGIIDFSKAVISSDEKALSKAGKSLIKRFVAGVIAIIIPTLPIVILNVIEVSKGIENNNDFGACTKCIFDPFNSCN